jgi:hypothetical protein
MRGTAALMAAMTRLATQLGEAEPRHDRTTGRCQRPDRRHSPVGGRGERDEGHRRRARQHRPRRDQGRRQLCRDNCRRHIRCAWPRSPASPAKTSGGQADGSIGLLVFCAEQGFAGAFSERVLDSIEDDLSATSLFLIGTRGLSIAAARGLHPVWSAPMSSHTPGIPKLADRSPRRSTAPWARVVSSVWI